MMKKIAVIVLVLCVLSSHMECVEPSVFDCMDACSTGCVQSNTRLMQRCEGKCRIKCDPGRKLASTHV
ncbi:hypothetical protein L1049_028027 [Liquidambar formosana]|uniref:Thionin-like protein n=1 Tax=Liquidambar formosana TaxID=63359 RepID=A0AAP0RJS4_LIQFO